jgi:hypothetical protein
VSLADNGLPPPRRTAHTLQPSALMPVPDPVFVFWFALVALVPLLAGTLAGVRLLRARRRASRRIVERPNSHYTAPLVRDRETRHRWHDIALDRVHEINRDEVRRLLAKVEAAGVASLRPTEHTFLDGVAGFAGSEQLRSGG